jgi:hypothetical protein
MTGIPTFLSTLASFLVRNIFLVTDQAKKILTLLQIFRFLCNERAWPLASELAKQSENKASVVVDLLWPCQKFKQCPNLSDRNPCV